MIFFKCSDKTLINIDKVICCYVERSKIELDEIMYSCVFDCDNKTIFTIYFDSIEEAQKEVDDFENFCIRQTVASLN